MPGRKDVKSLLNGPEPTSVDVRATQRALAQTAVRLGAPASDLATVLEHLGIRRRVQLDP